MNGQIQFAIKKIEQTITDWLFIQYKHIAWVLDAQMKCSWDNK